MTLAPGASTIQPGLAVARTKQVTTLTVVFLPLVLAVGTLAIWVTGFGGLDLGLSLPVVGTYIGMYLMRGFGITAGYHRYFTHMSYVPARWLKLTLAAAGSMALQGPVDHWVADHQRHHVYTDKPGDPHSPHSDEGSWFHAHVAWLFRRGDDTDTSRFGRHIRKDPDMRFFIGHAYIAWMVLSFVIPFAVGYAIGGVGEGLRCLLWSGVIGLVMLHHSTWAVNSVCHMMGARKFETPDYSRNVWWMIILTLGEAWHNIHHFAQKSARQGPGKGWTDPSWCFLYVLMKLRQVRRVQVFYVKADGNVGYRYADAKR